MPPLALPALPASLDALVATFVAIDFETADHGPDSACAVGLVRVERGRIVRREHRLIRPPRSEFVFTPIHGITADDVASEPLFAEVWASLSSMLDGIDFVAAHNARFDHGVLTACASAAGVDTPPLPWLCTVTLSRSTWPLPSARLSAVCEHLGIPLQHHQALSDAEACALIVLAAAGAAAHGERLAA